MRGTGRREVVRRGVMVRSPLLPAQVSRAPAVEPLEARDPLRGDVLTVL